MTNEVKKKNSNKVRDLQGEEIDVSKIDLERMKTQVSSLPSMLDYAHGRSSALIKPEDEGKIKSRALKAMEQQTGKEFNQILNQMKPLVDQMEKLKRRVYISETIYTAHIPFEPAIGSTYYLYLKNDGSSLLSIVSPHEWGKSMPYKAFEGKVTLLADHTWDVIDDDEDDDIVEEV